MTDTAKDTVVGTETLTIGAFARASRLSLKALRLYGDLGLLAPARVDPDTGYRFYRPEQIGTARLIGLLRQLDLPLSEIQAVLEADASSRATRLSAFWGQTEREHRQRRALAQYLIETLQGESIMTQTFAIGQRFVPAQRVVTMPRRLYVGELSNFIGEAREQLGTLAGAQASGPAFVIFYGQVNADSDGPVEVCLPFTGVLTVPEDVTVREEPAHTEAFVALTREEFEFPGILHAYDAVARYAGQRGECEAFFPREVYPVPWKGLQADDFAGEVAWPFIPYGKTP
ncbi:MerR family transcriptional regulator [Deinococcus deserti]|uniref:Putative transcriptional regulator, MerR family n=1 Tax=Deinococcus deserti (strain DSM 17065 / CIP 109153 / LMG 22923 / VCD115) TaxID=546414 RepID=C1D361_DEIDV|nr:MerR family transcriptional regulator [Deinococcus deserti]ACO47850.1 putative transcriptional regulator, MerR family [Deinococcus deserti VCD115]